MSPSRQPVAGRSYHPLPGPPSPWPWRGLALGLGGLTLLYVVILLGYQAGDPTLLYPERRPVHHPLGLPGALLAAAIFQGVGMAAWWWLLFLPLAAVMTWREREGTPLFLIACGGVLACLASAALLGFAGVSQSLGGASAPMGGLGGQAMADGLRPLLGKLAGVGVPLVILGLGLVVVAWGAWPLLGPYLEPRLESEAPAPPPALLEAPAAPAAPAPPEVSPAGGAGGEAGEPIVNFGGPEPIPAAAPPAPSAKPTPPPPPPPPPPPEPVAGPADHPPAAAAAPEANPRIRPRTPAPAPAALPAGPLPGTAGEYRLPGLELLREPVDQRSPEQADRLMENSRLLVEKLAHFNVQGRVVEVAPGPVVTMYEYQPAPGVKISKVAGLSDDLAMNLKAQSIRIVAPIPGKAVIGIEIPNQARETVFLRELLASAPFQTARSRLTIALGKDILGAPVVGDLAAMPHLLIAGATGSGKSVFVNTMVLSLLYRATPAEVRLLMVDPKRIELSTYNDIPHLLHPIITSPQDATAGLRWAVGEMERRYELLARLGVRNIASFNQRLAEGGWRPDPADPEEEPPAPLPYIVIIIDELADLMMVASKEVEGLITRLAQMARAAGIHLVLATQRPSVDVITGLIKANFPARLSFQVTSRVDSRTILDQQGAENLLGKGDLLFIPPGTAGLTRLHGAFVSDAEIQAVADFVRGQGRPDYDETIVQSVADDGAGELDDDEADPRYADAVALVKSSGQASISYVQRRLRVGYNRAARMIEMMERDGIVGPSDGSRPREVLARE